MDTLSSLERLTQAGFVAAALGVALWGARRSLASSSSAKTGETVWQVVAIAMLAGVSLAVTLGGGHGV